MKFIIFNGSPAGANSSTHVIAEAFLRGAKQGGADTKEKTQQFVVISNSGFPGNNNFETMKAVFSCCNPTLEIYRNCGKLLKSNDSSVKLVVN